MNSNGWRCKICQAEEVIKHVFREMMFGFRDQFNYTECSNCGCIQIDEIPADIGKYYPPYYYSFNLSAPSLKRQPLIKRLLGNIRMKRVYQRTSMPELSMLKLSNVKVQDKILDVGCGNGALICRLFNKGFEHVQGVDKFIPQEIDHGFGVKVLKRGLNEIAEKSYDVVMMHHVLEHVEEQLKELQEANRILKREGHLIVRIPLKSEAWNMYKNNWVQLDAPRHFFLHTIKSIHILAEQAGFIVRQKFFDSTAFQFLGSEIYKRDIPLHLSETHQPDPIDRIFSEEKIAEYEMKSEKLNEMELGDQAAFYLYKK